MKSNDITVTDNRLLEALSNPVSKIVGNTVPQQIKKATEALKIYTGVVTKFYPYLDKAEVKLDKGNKKVLCKILHRYGGELLDFYTPFGEQTLCETLKEPCVIPRDTLHCLIVDVQDFDSNEHLILGFYMNEEIVGLNPAKPGNMKLITRGGSNHHWLSFGYCGLDVRTSKEPTQEIGSQTDEVVPIEYANQDNVYDKEEVYNKEEVDELIEDIPGGGGAEIVTEWETTTSDEKVPSEKLVKTDLDKKIAKSTTSGLVKNDGTIDTNTYLTEHQSLSNYIQKNNTEGLVKNDGTIDTNTYLTSHQDISGKEDTSNRKTSWGSTVSDNKYPSEKLVKDSLDDKVDKVSGKGLSANDFTNTLKSKLDNVEANANNYSHPASHPASMITGLATVATSGDYDDLDNKPSFPSSSFTLRDTITDSGATVKIYDDGFYVYVKFSGTATLTANANTQLGTLSNLAYAPIEGYEYAPINQGPGEIYCYGAVNASGNVYVINTSASTSLGLFGGLLYPLKSRLPSTYVTLTADKSALSYYNTESATLSATVVDHENNPCSGETVEFFNGSTSMGTSTTNANGVATKSYSSAGVGDVIFTAKCGGVTSEPYTIEDCIYWNSSEISYTSSYTSGDHSIKVDSNFTTALPTNCEVSLDVKTNIDGSRLQLSSNSKYSSSTSNYGFGSNRDSSYINPYYRSTSSNRIGSGISRDNNYHSFKFLKTGTSLESYMDNVLQGTNTLSWLNNYNDYTWIWWVWKSGTIYAKNIKIKPL